MAEGELRIGIIGGTGLGDSLFAGIPAADLQVHHVETPFGRPSAAIHLGRIGEVDVAMLSRHGEGHLRNPREVPYRANVCALRQIGCTHVIATGATGSLREEIAPGHLVLCDQVIDRTEGRPRTFYDRAAVHVEFADPFCPVMRRWLQAAAARVESLVLHPHGTYICMEGPSFSTRAESTLYRQWGADVVGMTALPEARLAREAEMAYALIALPTDYDCWRPRAHGTPTESLLGEIIANLERCMKGAFSLIRAALEDVALLRATPSPAHEALNLAIWSDKARIDPEEVKRLKPLWGRHFE